jgi:hypothetical protein
MDRNKRIESWKKICNDYVKTFCKKHSLQGDWYWIADEVGGLIEVCDMFINLNTIRYDIDHDIEPGRFETWYSRSVEMYEANLPYMNYENFCKSKLDNCYDESKIQRVNELREKINDIKNEIEEITGVREFY